MIQIGAFQFPIYSTFSQTRAIEAKSKIRKEIEITSVIEEPSDAAFREAMAALGRAVEQFDRRQAFLSIHPGRFYHGRRRLFHAATNAARRIAHIQASFLTEDRFERGIALHQMAGETFYGHAQMAAFAQGNWNSPPTITLTPKQDIEQIVLSDAFGQFELDASIEAGQAIVIDSEQQSVFAGESNLRSKSNEMFPELKPGENHLRLAVEPPHSEMEWAVEFRDVWA